MDLQQFEQEILRLAFETDSRITTASVAYYLGIPSRQANNLLNQLLEEGVLELDSDASGNLYYEVPTKSDEANSITDLKKSIESSRQRVENGARGVVVNMNTESFSATIDDDEGDAFRPVTTRQQYGYDADAGGPGAEAPPQHRGELMRYQPQAVDARVRESWSGDQPNGSQAIIRKPRESAKKEGPVWGSATTRAASTDGNVGTSGGSPFLMATEARCDSRPLPDQKPIVTSCNEPVEGTSQMLGPVGGYADDASDWFNPREESTAMVPAGDSALAHNYYIEQPEHQPGMALLLSLILCGTGQIYNGEVSKGIMMMVLCFLLWFVLLGWVVHIWSIVDAVVVAERLNRQPQDQ